MHAINPQTHSYISLTPDTSLRNSVKSLVSFWDAANAHLNFGQAIPRVMINFWTFTSKLKSFFFFGLLEFVYEAIILSAFFHIFPEYSFNILSKLFE